MHAVQRLFPENSNADNDPSEHHDAQPTGASKAKDATSTNNHRFPIVALGASAGGVEAFNTFFSHMPPDSSMVFVVVTHLNAGQESQLAALIGYRTQVQVCQVGHGMKVGPDHVYVIRPLKRPTFAKGTEII